MALAAPAEGENWIALTPEVLPVGDATSWATLPRCGAVLSFIGVVRDHSEGRTGVTALEYEAYEEEARPRMESVVAESRRRWPSLGRVAILHRTGALAVGEVSVVVVASAPHRAEAFDAARFCIDTVKRSVPIWKRESWDGGEGWSADGCLVEDVGEVAVTR